MGIDCRLNLGAGSEAARGDERVGRSGWVALGRDLGNRTLTAKLKHHSVERALRLPGKLERERGLAAARLAVEQRAARFLRDRGVKHLKGLSAAHKILRWRRKKDATCACLRNTAHVAKALDPRHGFVPPFFWIGPRVDP